MIALFFHPSTQQDLPSKTITSSPILSRLGDAFSAVSAVSAREVSLVQTCSTSNIHSKSFNTGNRVRPYRLNPDHYMLLDVLHFSDYISLYRYQLCHILITISTLAVIRPRTSIQDAMSRLLALVERTNW